MVPRATGGLTLHQLRHSAQTHVAEAGANTSTLLAFSGHTSVTSLARHGSRIGTQPGATEFGDLDLPTGRKATEPLRDCRERLGLPTGMR